MKALFILLISSLSWGWTVDNIILIEADDSFSAQLVWTCQDSRDLFCSDLCNGIDSCRQDAKICLNCAGTASPFMKMLFVALPDFYFSARQVQSEEFLSFLQKQSYTVINENSIFNFYTAPKSEQLKKQFASFCPAGAQNPNFFLKLDGQNEPVTVEYVTCQVDRTKTLIFKTDKKTLTTQRALH